MTRDYRLFIEDILHAIDTIDDFVKDMDFDKFMVDYKTESAVVWQIHVIGEATKNIPKPFLERYNKVPWKYMARMRDKIAHFYFGVDYDIVWKVIKERLPAIKPDIEKILEELENIK